MEFNNFDLLHLENIIAIIKRQKHNDLAWKDIMAFSAALAWLDHFHDLVKESVENGKTDPVLAMPKNDLSAKVKKQNEKK